MANDLLSRSYIDGVYIPSGLLVVGCLIVKREWAPYAVVLALLLGGWKVYSNSKCSAHIPQISMLTTYPGVKSVLKPAEFQNFELKEKTIISHNVAMSVSLFPSPLQHHNY